MVKVMRLCLVILILVVGIYMIDRVLFAPERERNSRINNRIFSRFHEIDNFCRSYITKKMVNQTELGRCKKVVAINDYCDDNWQQNEMSSTCYTDEYYRWLQQLGFDLPKLYSE